MAAPLSINDLPCEILGVAFFEFVEQELDEDEGYQRPNVLMGVCRLWKEFVEGNPLLWSRIFVTFGGHALDIEPAKAQIYRAKMSPLALDIESTSRCEIAELTRDVLSLYDLVKEHRWRALSITDAPSLEPFEVIFRHMIDNPGMCRISSFRLTPPQWESNTGIVYTWAREALRHSLCITDLAIPMESLEPSHPLFRVVLHLHLLDEWSMAAVRSHIREASSLQRLRVSVSREPANEESMPPCLLPRLIHLELQESAQFPIWLLRQLDLPIIHSLKFKNIYASCNLVDEQLTSLVLTVPWLKRIKSLTLDEAQVSEATLLWMLWRLPLLASLGVAALRITGRMTKALSHQLMARRQWLCPFLEEIRFGSCRKLLESDVVALVRARVCDAPNATLHGIMKPDLSRLRMVIWESRDMVRETFRSGEMQV
ncbi:hypothetical protein FRB94_006423 [Tulasnella sp. JGI-2019a]|nr:hypothetical protein FRB94_006423 [Tulasnella sp. JGI-2019a]